ncbi:hypothetical protein BCR42DRAFT_392003 [Absidia repens]|uniref:Uncharacterized protein n=1 Tax=Absidia repens TaxID=90262 RepID=A0A1X2IK94_9FUNG|nr:hypothetical protein BCR42DRAFT_392003 [Absidia repens]
MERHQDTKDPANRFVCEIILGNFNYPSMLLDRSIPFDFASVEPFSPAGLSTPVFPSLSNNLILIFEDLFGEGLADLLALQNSDPSCDGLEFHRWKWKNNITYKSNACKSCFSKRSNPMCPFSGLGCNNLLSKGYLLFSLRWHFEWILKARGINISGGFVMNQGLTYAMCSMFEYVFAKHHSSYQFDMIWNNYVKIWVKQQLEERGHKKHAGVVFFWIRQLEKVGTKQKVLELVTHQDQHEGYQALTGTLEIYIQGMTNPGPPFSL